MTLNARGLAMFYASALSISTAKEFPFQQPVIIVSESDESCIASALLICFSTLKYVFLENFDPTNILFDNMSK